jgi:hypothetical protein
MGWPDRGRGNRSAVERAGAAGRSPSTPSAWRARRRLISAWGAGAAQGVTAPVTMSGGYKTPLRSWRDASGVKPRKPQGAGKTAKHGGSSTSGLIRGRRSPRCGVDRKPARAGATSTPRIPVAPARCGKCRNVGTIWRTRFAQFPQFPLPGPRPIVIALIRDPTIASGIGQLGAIQSAAPSLGMEASPVNVRDVGEIERNIAALAHSSNGGGVVVTGSPEASRHRDLSSRSRPGTDCPRSTPTAPS